MGSGLSTSQPDAHGPLKCPEGDDEQKFRKICLLFDSLDRDADMGVNADESRNVAVTFIRQQLESLRRRQATLQRQLQHDHSVADEEKARQIAVAQTELDSSQCAAQEELNRAIAKAQADFDAASKSIRADYDRKVAEASAEMDREKNGATERHGKALGQVTGKIQWYETLSPEDKGKAFIEAICGDASSTVGFWKFYEFMKRQDGI